MSSSAQLVQLKSSPLYSKGASGYSSQSPAGDGSNRDSRISSHRTGESNDRGAISSSTFAYSASKYGNHYVSPYRSAAPERHSSSHGHSSSGAATTSGSLRHTSSVSQHALGAIPSAPPVSAPSILDKVIQMPSGRGSLLQTVYTRGVSSRSSGGGSSSRTSYPHTSISHRTSISSINPSFTTSDYSSSDSQRARARRQTFSTDDSPRFVSRNHSFSSSASAFSMDSTDLWSNSSPTYSSPRPASGRPSSPSSTCSDATSLLSQRSTSVPSRQSCRISMNSDYPDPVSPTDAPLTSQQHGNHSQSSRHQSSHRPSSQQQRSYHQSNQHQSSRDESSQHQSRRRESSEQRIERTFSGSMSGSLTATLVQPAPVAAHAYDGRAMAQLIRSISPGQGCVGLSNLGNTCFMNSIIQSLNAVPELVAEFRQQRLKWSDKAYVAPAYAHLVAQMWGCSYGSVLSPNAFLRAVSRYDNRWGSGRQQDSQEFLHSLLEALQSECNRINEKPKYLEQEGKGTEQQQADEAERYARSWNDSVIDDIFGGQLQSTIECQVCKRQSHCFDPFVDLCVQMPSSKKGLSVASCMAGFVEIEKLDNSESYKCKTCKKFQPATKQLQIYRYPRVLVLTLKRFSASSTFSRFSFTSKNSAAVSIDSKNHLDLSPFCNPAALKRFSASMPPPIYKLIAVSNHSGNLGGGHYTTQCRSMADGKWCDFNDSSVLRDSPPSNPSSSAYVLFYRLAYMDSNV